VPSLHPDRLSKWCVFAGATFLLAGIVLIKGAGSIDVIVFGSVLIGIGVVCGLYAYRLNPRIVRRFLNDD